MLGFSSTRAALAAAVALCVLGFATSASAQAPPAGLGDQLFSTGGEITVEVLPSTAGLLSELRLYNADGTFTPLATNREVGRVVTLPARPRDEELVFGIFIAARNHTFKIGPGERNPDGLVHARVQTTGERQFDVGFEDLINGGDRDYDDNVFRFRGGLAPNRVPVADDQELSVTQGGTLPIKLTGSDPDGDPLTYALSEPPRHGALQGTGADLTYRPEASFTGIDTFGFSVDDGGGAKDDAIVTVRVLPATGGSNQGASGPPDCIGELTLLNVRRVGRRVLLTGLAERTLAGAPVTIVEGGVVVARTRIGADATFGTRIPVPTQRGGRVLRYQAKLGTLQSRNVRLNRRLVLRSARLRSGRVVLTGKVSGAPRRGTRPLVRLLARPRGCGTRRIQVGRARLRRDGTFRVSGAPLPGVDVAVYQARVKLRGRTTTFSLPQTITRR
jgi:Big-like domain-containing protein